MALPQSPTTRHQHAAPEPPRNWLGIAGFALGLLGLLCSLVPVIGIDAPAIGVAAWPLVIIGLVVGGVGSSGGATGKGLAVTGVALSALGLVVCVLGLTAFGKPDGKEPMDDLERQANKESKVVYEISGDAKSAAITFTTYSDGGSTSNKENATKLPWTKELTVKGFLSGGSLAAMAGPDGGTVTCKITVDGVEKKTASATGPGAMATCSNF